MVSDVPSSQPNMTSKSNIVLALNGDNEAILQGYWDALKDSGNVTQPLEVAPWGDIFDSVTDKLGVSWMFDIFPSDK